MHACRWLLPFTHGVDKCAIETVIHLAQESGAVVVPVALIAVAHGEQGSGARLEHIQQAKDFCELIRHIALRYQIPIEGLEVFTADVKQGITMLVSDLRCDSVVLVHSRERALLLQTRELEELLMAPSVPLFLVRLERGEKASLLEKLSMVWLSRQRNRSPLPTASARKPRLHPQ